MISSWKEATDHGPAWGYGQYFPNTVSQISTRIAHTVLGHFNHLKVCWKSTFPKTRISERFFLICFNFKSCACYLFLKSGKHRETKKNNHLWSHHQIQLLFNIVAHYLLATPFSHNVDFEKDNHNLNLVIYIKFP